jgi:ferredoxin
MLEILTKITEGKGTLEDIDDLEDLANNIKKGALCGLGQTAPNPVLSTLKYFRHEYEAHVVDKKCPAGVCKNLMRYVIKEEICKRCGICAKNCPVDAITRTDYIAPGHKLASFTIDTDKCVKCGVCMGNCKFKAINK